MKGMFGGGKHSSCCDSCGSSCGSGCSSGCCGGSNYGSGGNYGGYGYPTPAGQVMPKVGETIPAPKDPAKKLPDGKKTTGAPLAPLGEPLSAPSLSSTPASPRTLDLGRSPY